MGRGPAKTCLQLFYTHTHNSSAKIPVHLQQTKQKAKSVSEFLALIRIDQAQYPALQMLQLEILLWVVLPAVNFYIWFNVGAGTMGLYPKTPCLSFEEPARVKSEIPNVHPSENIDLVFNSLDSNTFHIPRGEHLKSLNYIFDDFFCMYTTCSCDKR